MREQKNEIENEERMVTNFIGNFKLLFTEDVIIARWCEVVCLFRPKCTGKGLSEHS